MLSPASGIFLFDKPAGITSHDAVGLLRRALGHRHIGHTGTLDPMATGLLVMLAGAATKLQSGLQGCSKTYTGRIKLGETTDTWDAEGEVLSSADPASVTREAVAAAIPAFEGKMIQQVPPYSAVKIGGRQLYKMARRKEAMPVVKREVELHWLSWDWQPPFIDFGIECAGGTYIRSVAHELGAALGCGGHLAALRRTRVAGWRVEDAVTADFLRSAPSEAVVSRLLPAEKGTGTPCGMVSPADTPCGMVSPAEGRL
ncbi:MAG: tRNA pseudouridine55 synthase [Elusimicrobia bacterium]|nr:MAG: tRNA pseudouridine55 synthase [Elusimicrobiota bacterium]KAF0155189.1 MAG: tRNA pseudouridine55 synthase [Elusimicrobiota bacterium]